MFETKRLKNIRALEKELLITRIELRREQLNYRVRSISKGFKAKLKETGKTLALPAIASVVIPGAISLISRGRIKPAKASRMGVSAMQILGSAIPIFLAYLKNTRQY